MIDERVIEILHRDLGVSVERIADFLGVRSYHIENALHGDDPLFGDLTTQRLLLLLEAELDKRQAGCTDESTWIFWKRCQLMGRLARELKGEQFTLGSDALEHIRRRHALIKSTKL